MMILAPITLTIIICIGLFSSSFTVEVTLRVEPDTHVTEHQATKLIYNYTRSNSTSVDKVYCRWSKNMNGKQHFIAAYQDGIGKAIIDKLYREKMSIDQYGNLLITRIAREDAGTYECEVRIFDDKPFINNDKVNVTVLYIDAPTINLTEFVVDGDVFDIFCYSGAAHPDPILTIYNDLKPIASTTGTTLNFTNSNASKKDTGDYYCSASNKAGIKDSDKEKLIVQYIACQNKLSFDSIVSEDNMLSITCQVDAEPNPKYTIYKDNKTIKSEIGDVLVHTIDKVKKEDTGNYYCKATNTAGTVACGQRSLFVTFTALQPDVLVSQLTSGSVGFLIGCFLLLCIFCIVKRFTHAQQTVNTNPTDTQLNQAVYQSLIKDDGKKKVEQVTELGTQAKSSGQICHNLRDKVVTEGPYEYIK